MKTKIVTEKEFIGLAKAQGFPDREAKLQAMACRTLGSEVIIGRYRLKIKEDESASVDPLTEGE